MLRWIMLLIALWIAYYTLTYARIVWEKEENRIAVFVIVLLGLAIGILPIWMQVTYQIL